MSTFAKQLCQKFSTQDDSVLTDIKNAIGKEEQDYVFSLFHFYALQTHLGGNKEIAGYVLQCIEKCTPFSGTLVLNFSTDAHAGIYREANFDAEPQDLIREILLFRNGDEFTIKSWKYTPLLEDFVENFQLKSPSDISIEVKEPGKILQFYSKSKDVQDLGSNIPANWRKVLSNFYPSPINIDGKKYDSIEHYFHAAKAMCSNKPEMAENFISGGSIGPNPLDAKRAGGKGAYTKTGALLNINKWNKVRDEVTRKAVLSRYNSDPTYKKIIDRINQKNIYLLHFERTGPKSYWGGSYKDGQIRGENKLGQIIMELGRKTDKSSYNGHLVLGKSITIGSSLVQSGEVYIEKIEISSQKKTNQR